MSHPGFGNWRRSWPMPSPCAVAPFRNVPSNAASQVALVRRIQRLVTVLITASRMRSEARRCERSEKSRRRRGRRSNRQTGRSWLAGDRCPMGMGGSHPAATPSGQYRGNSIANMADYAKTADRTIYNLHIPRASSASDTHWLPPLNC